jgi:hypothetical protein
MQRFKAAFFLLVAPILMALAVALTWHRAQGNVIAMHRFLELWIWGAALASLSAIVWMAIVLLRGR